MATQEAPMPVDSTPHIRAAGVTAGNFNEEWYLLRYPDVRQAVEKGAFKSAFDHFCLAGIREQRAFRTYVDNPDSALSLRHAPFRYLFYAAADAHQVPHLRDGETLEAYIDRTFRKQGLIHD